MSKASYRILHSDLAQITSAIEEASPYLQDFDQFQQYKKDISDYKTWSIGAEEFLNQDISLDEGET